MRTRSLTVFAMLVSVAELILLILGGLRPAAAQAQNKSMAPVAPTAFDCTSVSEIPLAECQALVALYNSTNGANWSNNSTVVFWHSCLTRNLCGRLTIRAAMTIISLNIRQHTLSGVRSAQNSTLWLAYQPDMSVGKTTDASLQAHSLLQLLLCIQAYSTDRSRHPDPVVQCRRTHAFIAWPGSTMSEAWFCLDKSSTTTVVPCRVGTS
jgi:hypothetical protein